VKRAGKEGHFKRAKTEVVSVSLTPASVYLLNQLAVEHGGAGRAIQIAVELLSVRKKPVKLTPESDGIKQPFSFAAFPRTIQRINRIGLRYDWSKNEVIRACIQQLYEVATEDFQIMDFYGRDADAFKD
jgi:hypothetical protein